MKAMKCRHGALVPQLMMALMILTSAGCITIEREGGDFLTETDVATRSGVSSCIVRQITAVRPVLTTNKGVYELRLEADGEFICREERFITSEVSGRKRVMGVGFFPALLVPNTHEFAKSGPMERIFAVVLFNAGLAGLPTLCSLLIEPFREHYLLCANSTPTDWGLIGCRKYLVKVEPHRKVRRDTSDQQCSTVTLSGYAAELNGRLFRPDRDGVIRFSMRSGAVLRIKIAAPPTFSEDPSLVAKELVGLELQKTCP